MTNGSLPARFAAAVIAVGTAGAFALAGAAAANADQSAASHALTGTFPGPGASVSSQPTGFPTLILHADGYGIGG